MAKYSAAELRTMLAKGQAMKNPAGDPSYPIADEEDLQSAIHAVGLGGASNNAIRKYIMGRAKSMGKTAMIPDTWQADGSLGGGESGGSSRALDLPYCRNFPLEDISIRAGGDGRTVDAYAAVFDTPAAIRDQDGQYEEVLDRSCFNQAIRDAAPTGSRQNWKIRVMFNHGMTMYQTPSDQDSMPIGVPLEIKPDSKGLFTRTKYLNTPRADEVLENIREGAITAYSFQGAFKRSEPSLTRGGRYKPDGRGNLPTVRRMESTLREYGPTPFPAYQEAAVVGIRAEQVALLVGSLTPDERERLAELFRSDASEIEEVASEDSRPVSGEMRSGRTLREELQAQRARFIIRHGGDT